MLSWQNILNSRQIAADIEEKLANQGEVFHISSFTEESAVFTYQTNENHAMEPYIVSHIISEQHWKSAFDFREIVNKVRVELCSFTIHNPTMHDSPINYAYVSLKSWKTSMDNSNQFCFCFLKVKSRKSLTQLFSNSGNLASSPQPACLQN